MLGGNYHETRVEHIPTLEACQIISKFYTEHYRIERYDSDSVICVPVIEPPALNIREVK